jgi:hypothetical protein
MNILDKWKEIVRNSNENGVPIPMIRVDGKASLSATLAFLSFNIWAVSVVGKAAGALGGMDTGACLQMFLSCSALYWGRKFQRDDKGNVSVSKDKE